jgi:hypothetical protein
MCDFSLQSVKSRPAVVGDKLVTKNFGTGTRGFACQNDPDVAVCVLPGTEIGFANPAKAYGIGADGILGLQEYAAVAIFRQIDKEIERTHHDCLEFPNGERVLLTKFDEGQEATVLQLPAAPKTEAEAQEQKRLEIVG